MYTVRKHLITSTSLHSGVGKVWKRFKVS